MHLVAVPANTAAGSANAKITNKGVGSIIGTVTVTITTSATSFVGLQDGVTGSSPLTLVASNTPIGVYSLTLNAISRAGDWWVNTSSGVRCVVSTPHPNSAPNVQA